MDVAILSGLISNVLGGLVTALAKEVFSYGNAKENFEDLRDIYQVIEQVLVAQQASKLPSDTTDWLSQLEDLTNYVDDILDETVARATSVKYRLCAAATVAKKLKVVRSKLKTIADGRSLIIVNNPHYFERLPHRKIESHSSPPLVLVGLEDSKSKMVDILIHSEYADDIVAVPIVGMGGLGKTTLAQSIFQCKELKGHFDMWIWIDVSQDDDLKSIVKKILINVDKKECDHFDMETLKELLVVIISGRKFLIVLDDVWTDKGLMWEGLRDLLSRGAKGSRLVVTTRHFNVAKASRPGEVFELDKLSEDNSWKLFESLARQNNTSWEEEQYAIGKEIVAKCYGVPLAVKTVGLLLQTKDVDEWRWIRANEMKIKQRDGYIMPILRMSYNHLPHHLKLCFLYCGTFCTDKTIPVDKLVKLWMMFGLIQKGDMHLPDEFIARRYVWELIWSSMLEHVRDEGGLIVTVRMHDLYRELCAETAQDKIAIYHDGDRVRNATRHMKVYGMKDAWKDHIEMLSAKGNIRSLILSGRNLKASHLTLIFSALKRLRILDLEFCYCDKIPSSISNLLHLRYLDLSNSNATNFPDSIAELWHLRILKMENCHQLETLPMKMRKLVNLTELNNNFCPNLSQMPKGIGELTNLSILPAYFLTHKKSGATLEEIRGLINLRGDLAIFGLGNVDVRKCSEGILANMEGLTKLELFQAKNIETLNLLKPHQNLLKLGIIRYEHSIFPDWMFNLPFLHTLRLCGCAATSLSPIHTMPRLTVLIIEYMYLEYIETSECEKTYEHLRFIELRHCNELKRWCEIGEAKFPSLEKIEIWNCPNFDFITDEESVKIVNYGPCSKMTGGNVVRGIYQQIILNVIVDLWDKEDENVYIDYILSIDGTESISFVKHTNTTTITGVVDPTILVDKLREIGLSAQIVKLTPIEDVHNIQSYHNGWCVTIDRM